MKLFAMLMLRNALIILLSSLLQNGTLAQNEKELKKWEESCRPFVVAFSDWQNKITLADALSNIPNINQSLDLLLEEVDKFPMEGIKELLDRRLQKPLKIAKFNCNKLFEIEHSGREANNTNLESLLSKIHSIAMGIKKEFNTFIFEVELELIKKVKWTSGNKKELENTFKNLWALAQKIESYCNPESFNRAFIWVSGMGGPQYEPGTPQFVECLGILILNAKLNILKKELAAKIAVFAHQPHIDGDGFMEFSHNFKLEWNQIEQQMGQVNNSAIASTMRLNSNRKELNDLAKTAMEETDPLKSIMTKKLDQLITKCQNSKFNEEETSNQLVATKGKSKNPIKQFLNKREQKKQIKAKNEEIYAMKQIISDIGMFDGAAFNVLVRFEQNLDNTAFSCAELEKAVEQDKEMVSKAYQVQQDKKLRRKK